MPLGTLDRNPPPFFKQGTSALTKLIIFSFVSMALMLADQRYNLVQPARWVLSIIIYPVQWVALRPQVAWYDLGDIFEGKQDVLDNLQAAKAQLLTQSVRTSQLEQLELENRHLRELLELRQRMPTPSLAAEVLYEAGDPYTPQDGARQRCAQWCGSRLAGDGRAGHIGTNHPRTPVGERNHFGHRPRALHSCSQYPHQRAWRGIW